ncbi:hypothetical protein ILUMI_21920 [Ignelater luminosus]|uniref:Uncharacterized protein n=1 Tax=Ignelater luminosus TaxID=2038154 RepID=A0A8K0CGU3_IGNLU|nr:hypothetical protein ILUMI_21920 [Ignelater luminosus]
MADLLPIEKLEIEAKLLKVWHRNETNITTPGVAVAGMTVQDEARAMPQTAATRSRFMITDILNSPGDGAAVIRGRSPSPGPRDLSLHSVPLHADSDTDSSGHPDTSSVCSNVPQRQYP